MLMRIEECGMIMKVKMRNWNEVVYLCLYSYIHSMVYGVDAKINLACIFLKKWLQEGSCSELIQPK